MLVHARHLLINKQPSTAVCGEAPLSGHFQCCCFGIWVQLQTACLPGRDISPERGSQLQEHQLPAVRTVSMIRTHIFAWFTVSASFQWSTSH
jgi:hypothetical protein